MRAKAALKTIFFLNIKGITKKIILASKIMQSITGRFTLS